MADDASVVSWWDVLLDTEGAEVPLALLILVLVFWWWRQQSAVADEPILPPANPRTAALRQQAQNSKSSKNGNGNGSAAAKEDEDDGSVHLKIFFGSQTGTAEDFAHTLAREARRLKFRATVIDLEDYDPEDFPEEKQGACIFCLATYGEGEPTDNAKEFYEWLMSKERGDDELKGVTTVVFGLGNKTYEPHYNETGRRVKKRLHELGSTAAFKYGEGDDDLTLEEDFGAWKKRLWPALCKYFNMESSATVETDIIEDRYECQFHETGSSEYIKAVDRASFHLQCTAPDGGRGPVDQKNPLIVKIGAKRELHAADSDRSCMHIEIDVDSKRVRYEPGDHVGLFPENHPELVERLARRLKLDLDAAFTLFENQDSDFGNKRVEMMTTTVRQALTQWLDITGSPRRSALRALLNHISDPGEKNKLAALCDLEKPQPYQGWIVDSLRTLVCILDEFPSLNPPLACLLEHFPRLAPRYYSISSSQSAYPNSLHVTCVLTDFQTPAKRRHYGVCSTWLSKHGVADSIPLYVRTSKFRLPQDLKKPIVMIGPGTGLAPFRGFLQEICARKASDVDNLSGPVALFFGCRHPDQDFIYQDELTQYAREGTLTHLYTAFSRPTDGNRKRYVQDEMARDDVARNLVAWLGPAQQGYFYICGDARNMEKDVHRTLLKLFVDHGNMTPDAASKYVEAMQASGRYATDTWF